MPSESTEERSVTVTLPSELDDWLDDHATTLDVDREALLVQLLSSYRTTVELDSDDPSLDPLADEVVDDRIETAVAAELDAALGDELTARIETILDSMLDDRLSDRVDDAVADQVTESTNSVQRRLENRIEAVESEFDEKIVDVRERVIQVKREADAKASADHSHEQLDAVEDLSEDLTEIGYKLEQLREEYDETVPDHESDIEDIDDRLEMVEERLQTVAWVVSDLRQAHESDGGLEAVERIKRAAAKADIQRAKCESCGEGVTLSLLTDPECPHCEATVTNVEPAGGWFSKPKLLVASQLESGEDA